jgi:hypothetical protein
MSVIMSNLYRLQYFFELPVSSASYLKTPTMLEKQVYCQVDDVRQNTEPMSLLLCSN